jgi:hypothetical protein
MELAEERQQLVDLAMRVRAEDIPTAKRILQGLVVDPLWLSLESAPYDDEEFAPETIVSIAEAEASIARGEGIPHEEILREFGIE